MNAQYQFNSPQCQANRQSRAQNSAGARPVQMTGERAAADQQADMNGRARMTNPAQALLGGGHDRNVDGQKDGQEMSVEPMAWSDGSAPPSKRGWARIRHRQFPEAKNVRFAVPLGMDAQFTRGFISSGVSGTETVFIGPPCR